MWSTTEGNYCVSASQGSSYLKYSISKDAPSNTLNRCYTNLLKYIKEHLNEDSRTIF